MAAGVYLHVPFCKSLCSYCDFATTVYRDPESVETYTTALITELRSSQHSGIEIDTIYFGGGTPSLLSVAQVESVLTALSGSFRILPGAEITLEMNPATVTLEKLSALKAVGVNRASFGVQTFDDRQLRILARGHDADDARKTFSLLRAAGFSNVSFDLIAGLPGQTLSDWQRNLDEAVELDPEHLSLYILEIHEGTPLAQKIESGRQPMPDEVLAGKMYESMQKRLVSAGYLQYEISNFAKRGFESRHNNKYWNMEAVYGFGVSAHSFDGKNRRWSNIRNTGGYIEAIESGRSAVANEDRLGEERLAAEFGFLKLRLRAGIRISEFNSRFGGNAFSRYEPKLEALTEQGLVSRSGDSVYLTDRGMLFSNEVFEVFV